MYLELALMIILKQYNIRIPLKVQHKMQSEMNPRVNFFLFNHFICNFVSFLCVLCRHLGEKIELGHKTSYYNSCFCLNVDFYSNGCFVVWCFLYTWNDVLSGVKVLQHDISSWVVISVEFTFWKFCMKTCTRKQFWF